MCLVHRHGSAAEGRSIESMDCFIRIVQMQHVHEGEAAGPSRVAIGHDAYVRDASKRFKGLSEI